MGKLKILIPTAVLFLSPWTHKLIYNNFLLAWPSLDTGAAHFFGFMGAFAAFAATCILSSGD